MKQVVYILSMILFSILSLQANAQEDPKTQLLQELAKAPQDSTRLKILHKLTTITKYQSGTGAYYLNRLKEEAEKQGNDFYRCTAYLCGLISSYNQYDVDGVKYWNSLLEPVAAKNKFYTMLFQGKRCVIDFLQITGEYEREESESLALLKEAEGVGSKQGMIYAYQSLGNAYLVTYRDKEAFQAFEKAYELVMELGNEGSFFEIINSLIIVAERINDNESWLKYIKLEEKHIQGKAKKTIGEGSVFMMYIHQVAYYVKVSDMEEAGRYYQLAEKSYYASREAGIYKEYFMRISRSYYYKLKQYDKALLYSDTLLDLLRPVSELAYNEMLTVHADILYSLGREKEALDNFKKAKNGRDTLQLQILNTQTDQVKNIHHVYLLELEKDKNRHYLQLTILVFLLISILIIVGFILYIYRIRKKLEHDESEIRLMTREVELANQAKERFLSNISTSIGKPLDVVVDSSLLLASDQEIEDEQRVILSEIINKTSADLMQLINNILDLSRLEAGMMRFAVSDVEVLSLIHDVSTGIAIEQKREINIDSPESVLFLANIDGSRLLSVFHNLLASVLPEKKIQVSAKLNEDETELMIWVYESSLAGRDLSQEQIIRNEINRMIIHHFEGVYQNHADASLPHVYFTIKGRLLL